MKTEIKAKDGELVIELITETKLEAAIIGVLNLSVSATDLKLEAIEGKDTKLIINIKEHYNEITNKH